MKNRGGHDEPEWQQRVRNGMLLKLWMTDAEIDAIPVWVWLILIGLISSVVLMVMGA